MELKKGGAFVVVKKTWSGGSLRGLLCDFQPTDTGDGWGVVAEIVGEHSAGLVIQSTSKRVEGDIALDSLQLLIPWTETLFMVWHPSFGTSEARKAVGFIQPAPSQQP